MCGGLARTLQFYDTVERLEVATARKKVGALLAAAGYAMEQGGVALRELNAAFPLRSASSSGASGAPSGVAGHHTNAGTRTADAFGGEHRAMALQIVRTYIRDYLVFGIPLPHWARAELNFTALVHGAPALGARVAKLPR
jgi:hypothetical protein